MIAGILFILLGLFVAAAVIIPRKPDPYSCRISQNNEEYIIDHSEEDLK